MSATKRAKHLVHQHGTHRLKTYTGEQIEQAAVPKHPLLLPFLRAGGESLLWYSVTGKGKSWLTLASALVVAGEGTLFGDDDEEQESAWTPERSRDPQGFKVHFLDGELTLGQWQRRLAVLKPGLNLRHPDRIARNFQVTGRRMGQTTAHFPLLTNPDHTADLLREYERTKWKPDLLVWDNLTTLGQLRSEIDGAAYAGVHQSLAMLANAGISVAVVHHGRVRKDSGQRGSPALEVTFDAVFKLVPIEGIPPKFKRQPAALTIQQTKSRENFIPDMQVWLEPNLDGTSTWRVLYDVPGQQRGRPVGTTLDDFEALPPDLTIEEQAERLGVSRRTVMRLRAQHAAQEESAEAF